MDDIIYGRNPVREALQGSTSVNRVLLAKGTTHSGRNKDIEALAKKAGVPVEYVDRPVLREKAGSEQHQGVVAHLSPFSYVEVSDLLARAKSSGQVPLVVICDHIEDPHNLGAIIRSAEAFGAHGVVVPKKRSAPVTGTVVKASVGAALSIPVARVGNLVQAVEECKAQGLWIAATDMDGDDLGSCQALSGALAVVVGNEGHGISPLLKKHCDFTVRIPMRGTIGSLNASAAAAIVLYEIVRRQQEEAGSQ